MSFTKLLIITLLTGIGSLSYANAVDSMSVAQQFSRGAEFTDVKISPTGDYISTITKHEGKHKLLILDAKTKKFHHAVFFPSNAQVGNYAWANNERIVL